MTTPAEMSLDDVLNEGLGFFEAFRRMGFPAEELFLGLDPFKVFIVLRSQGKEFVAICGPFVGGDERALYDAWTAKAKWWNGDATHEERSALWDRSFAKNHAFDLATSMMVKGFVLPRSKACRHGALSMNRCVTCGKEMFPMRFPGEL